MNRIFSRFCFMGLLAVVLSSNAQAGLTLFLDPNDLDVVGPGPLSTEVDVFINWDGSGNNLITSISFAVTTPSEVVLQSGDISTSPTGNPLGFDLADISSTGNVSFTNSPIPIPGRNIQLQVGDNLLSTFTFDVNAATGSFPIGLTLLGATGAAFADIGGDFTAVNGGTLNVTAIPEPSSAIALGALAIAGAYLRRRKQSV